MGKVAQPNTPYCGGFTKGFLGGFTSENPPLSYTLAGPIATVSDATGVLGTVDLTGQLTPNEAIAASLGVEYCAGKPKAVLQWSSGSTETENTPISYTLETPSGEEGVKVDWGGGDIDILSGETWDLSDFQEQFFLCEDYKDFRGWVEIRIPLSGADLRNCSASFPFSSATATLASSGYDGSLLGGFNTYVLGYVDGCEIWLNGNAWLNAGINPQDDHQVRGGSLEFGATTYTVTTNTGATSSREAETPPVVTRLTQSWALSVNDATGQIFSAEYSTEPTSFRVTCYDYDIGEVTYACEGECPSGTEFQCRCEATNTLMCYGWDPENENLFRPLYTTSITSG